MCFAPPASSATGRTRPRAGSSARRPARSGCWSRRSTNPVYVRIIRGAFERALERDFVVLLVEDVDPSQADRTASRLVQSGRIDGLMIASAQPGHPLLRSVRRDRVPHVFVNRGGREEREERRHRRGASERRRTRAPRPARPPPDRACGWAARARHRSAPDERLRRRMRRRSGSRSRSPRVTSASAAARRPPTRSSGDGTDLTALYTSTLSQAVGVYHAAWQLGLDVAGGAVARRLRRHAARGVPPPAADDCSDAARRAWSRGASTPSSSSCSAASPRDVVVGAEPEVVVRSSTGEPR